MIDTSKYLEMQRRQYNNEALKWSLTNKDPVVGWYDYHESFPDYDTHLFRGIENTEQMVALEYGCGPARNIIRFNDRFAAIDGTDISENVIEKARLHLDSVGNKTSILAVCDGKSIPFGDNYYELVFSVICLQHIASYSVRRSIFEEVFRVLQPGGYFCFQMGFGGRPNSVGYYDEALDATGTNGTCDVSITDEQNLIDDLTQVGFVEYDSKIDRVCQDLHANWIWVKVRKPNHDEME